MNSLNLRQVCGGDTIKQADFGSELAFELLDEQYVKFRESLGELAKVILKKDNIAIYQTSVTIVNNTVSFKFDKILPVGSYVLEIIVGNYVFPSNNRVIITIEQTYGDFEPEYLVKVSYEELKADVDDLKSKVQELEDRPIVDTALTERVEALERKEDKDTVYDDTNIKEHIADLESKLKSLNTVRRAPTGYTLDRTTTPWTIWFNNGCGLQMSEYSPIKEQELASTIYGYGYSLNLMTTTVGTYPVPQNFIAASMGHISLNNFSKQDANAFLYFSPSMKVINPVRNDAEKIDWSHCYGEVNEDNSAYKRKHVFPRVCYELGIWSEADVLYLGAVKK